MLKRTSFFLFFIGLSLFSKAQFSEEYTKYKELYPDEERVRINDYTKMTLRIVDDEIKIDLDYTEEDIYLKSTANFFAERSLSYTSFFEFNDIEAYSLIFNGKKYKKEKVKLFSHKDELSGSVFYDDSRSVNFIFPKLEEGGKSYLHYSETINDPHFMMGMYFGAYFPILNTTYEIVVDKDIELIFKEFNTDSLNYEYSKSDDGKFITHKWVVKEMTVYKKEGNTVSFRNFIPHIIPIIDYYTTPEKGKVDVLGNVDDLYSWYYDFICDINQDEPNEELVKTVQEITHDKTTDLEKVKAIYYWAQQNIKYVAFEYALGGFIPRNANDIYTKKYGDCKDNSSILQEMMEIAELEGHLTWIGTRDIPYSYEEMPTPAVDNHMILSYIDGEDVYFLDATGRFYPLGLPTSFIQGKEALIAIDSVNYRIETVPVMPAETTVFSDSARIYIEGKKLLGKGTAISTGYFKIDLFNALENINDNHELSEFYRANLKKGNNKFIVNSFEEINKYDYEKDFIVNYDFTIDSYISSANDEIYVNLNLDKSPLGFKIPEEDILPKEYDYKSIDKYCYILEIPEGYIAEFIPEDLIINNDLFSVEISYKQIDNTIVYTQILSFNFLELSKEEQIEYNKIIKQISKAYRESIVLKKK